MSLPRILAVIPALLLSTAAAQGATVWGGVGTEVYVSPQAALGLSARVGQLGGVAVDVRGMGSVMALSLGSDPAPGYTVTADLLFSGTRPGLNVYGGPSIGLLGAASEGYAGTAWLFGGLGGLRGEFGSGPYGWFAEARARIAYSGTPTSSSSFNETPPFLPIGGLAVGVTYRF